MGRKNRSTRYYSYHVTQNAVCDNKNVVRTLFVLWYILSCFVFILHAYTNCDITVRMHEEQRYGQVFNSSMKSCYSQVLTVHRLRHFLHCADFCLRNSKCNFYNFKDFGIKGVCLLFRGTLEEVDSYCFSRARDTFDHWQAIIDREFIGRI